jgi:hypothetical protein
MYLQLNYQPQFREHGENMQVGVEEMKEVLRAVIPANEVIMIKGRPGIGKTEIVRQVVEELDRKIFLQHPAVDDLTDYKGFPVLDHDTRTVDFQPIGVMRDLVLCTEPCVWYLDDIGQAPMANQGGIMQWIGRNSRGLNEHRIPDECAIIMTTNDIEHNAGVAGFLDPFKNRPLTILELEPSHKEWMKYAQENSFNPFAISYIQRNPQHLNVPDKSKGLTGYPSSRSWEHVSIICDMPLSHDIKKKMVMGAVGEKIGNAFNAFYNTALNMPDIDEIVADPKNCRLPESTSEYYGAAQMLAHLSTKENIAQLLVYVDRFETDEYKQVFTSGMQFKEKEALATAEYTSWKIDNQKLFINTEEDAEKEFKRIALLKANEQAIEIIEWSKLHVDSDGDVLYQDNRGNSHYARLGDFGAAVGEDGSVEPVPCLLNEETGRKMDPKRFSIVNDQLIYTAPKDSDSA